MANGFFTKSSFAVLARVKSVKLISSVFPTSSSVKHFLTNLRSCHLMKTVTSIAKKANYYLKHLGASNSAKNSPYPPSVSNGVGLMVHQWEDDGIYFSFNGPSVKILRRLNFENREVTLVLDEGKNEIVVVC